MLASMADMYLKKLLSRSNKIGPFTNISLPRQEKNDIILIWLPFYKD